MGVLVPSRHDKRLPSWGLTGITSGFYPHLVLLMPMTNLSRPSTRGIGPWARRTRVRYLLPATMVFSTTAASAWRKTCLQKAVYEVLAILFLGYNLHGKHWLKTQISKSRALFSSWKSRWTPSSPTSCRTAPEPQATWQTRRRQVRQGLGCTVGRAGTDKDPWRPPS